MKDPMQLRDYLLGRLSEEERDQIGNRILEDPDFFDEMKEAEADLLDDLVRGKLAEADRAETERLFRDCSERVRFAKALSTRVSPARKGWRALGIAATITVLLAGGWLWTRQNRVSPIPPRAENVFAFSLAPNIVRGAARIPAVEIPAEATAIRISLEANTGGVASPWQARILDSGNQSVHSQSGDLDAAAVQVTLETARTNLRPGSYRVELRLGTELAEVYSFSIR